MDYWPLSTEADQNRVIYFNNEDENVIFYYLWS